MAIMLPNDQTYYNNGSKGERDIFNSLNKHLDEHWIVIHSYRWLRSSISSGRKVQGEGDFVLFHRDLGLLVIEVKGGDIEYANGIWYSTDHTGVKNKIQDPEKQASDTKFQLIERLKKKQFKRVPVYHAVWFPDVGCNQVQLPSNYNEQMVFDVKSLSDPESAVRNAFSFWNKLTGYQCYELAQEECDELISLLRPQLSLVRTLKRLSSELQDIYVRLTNEQLTLFDNLQLCKELSIIGRAGTGKTIVATEKARLEAQSGQKTLQLCYNTELARKINEIQHPSVDVFTVHSFALRYMKENFPARVQGTFETQEDFDFLMSEFSEVALEADSFYDVIIIDEGQDFQQDWLKAITNFRAEDSCMYIFYDPYQQLYSYDDTVNDDFLKMGVPYLLKRNLRNTDEISAASLNIINLAHSKEYFNGIKGKEPAIVFVTKANYDSMVSAEIHSLIYKEHLDEKEITVLTLTSFSSSQVSADDVRGCNFTTVRKFKGLENEVMVIVDVDLSHLIDPVKQRELYTAISRAKTHAILFFELDERFLNLATSKLKCTEDELPKAIQQYITKGEFNGEKI